MDITEAEKTLLLIGVMRTAIWADSFELFISFLHVLKIANAEEAEVVIAADAAKYMVEVAQADWAVVAVFQLIFFCLLIDCFDFFHFNFTK